MDDDGSPSLTLSSLWAERRSFEELNREFLEGRGIKYPGYFLRDYSKRNAPKRTAIQLFRRNHTNNCRSGFSPFGSSPNRISKPGQFGLLSKRDIPSSMGDRQFFRINRGAGLGKWEWTPSPHRRPCRPYDCA